LTHAPLSHFAARTIKPQKRGRKSAPNKTRD
jgi:hypothetical protein